MHLPFDIEKAGSFALKNNLIASVKPLAGLFMVSQRMVGSLDQLTEMDSDAVFPSI